MDKSSKILITGAHGFLGNHVYNILEEKGYENLITFRSSEYDLTKESEVEKLFTDNSPIDIVIHLAAKVGGIMYNKENKGRIFYDNLMMNTLIQEYAYKNNVEKFVGIGSVCEYPKSTPVPFKEENLWEGYPEPTNSSYAFTKRMLLEQSLAYNEQYNFKSIHLLLGNLYGPKDNFHPEHSHVIPATIRRMVEAKDQNKEEITMWGTGIASREFLYVNDAAEAIVLATEYHKDPQAVNIGSGMETTIKELTEKVAEIVGYSGKINWDSSKPDGHLRRALDISKSQNLFNFKAKTGFDEGLKNTIEWYLDNKN